MSLFYLNGKVWKQLAAALLPWADSDDRNGRRLEVVGQYSPSANDVFDPVDIVNAIEALGAAGGGVDPEALQSAFTGALQAIIGAVAANPDPDTVQDRLKSIAAALGGTLNIAAAALPLPAGAATQATLADADSKLAGILSALHAQADLATTLWIDDSGAFYVRRDVIGESGEAEVSFTDPTGEDATPGAGLRPAANEEALATLEALYAAKAGGAGYSLGDIIVRQVVVDQNASPPTVAASAWINLITGAVIAAPSAADIELIGKGEAVLTAIRDRLPAALGAQASAASLSVAPATDARFFTSSTPIRSTAAPTVTTTPYEDGDLIGTKLSFANAVRVAAGSAMLQTVQVTSKLAQDAQVDLVLFNEDPGATVFTDNAAFVIADADLAKVIAVVELPQWSRFGAKSIAQAMRLATTFKLTTGTTLYGALVARGGVTTAPNDLQVAAASFGD